MRWKVAAWIGVGVSGGGLKSVRPVIRGKCALQQIRVVSTVVRQGQALLMEHLSEMCHVRRWSDIETDTKTK